MIGHSGRLSPSQAEARCFSASAISLRSRARCFSSATCSSAMVLTSALLRWPSLHSRRRSRIWSMEKPRSRARRMKASRWMSAAAVIAIAAVAAGRRRDQVDALVVADHLGRHAGRVRGLSDVHGALLRKRLTLPSWEGVEQPQSPNIRRPAWPTTTAFIPACGTQPSGGLVLRRWSCRSRPRRSRSRRRRHRKAHITAMHDQAAQAAGRASR